MEPIEIFHDPAFEVLNITGAITHEGMVPGQIDATGVFDEDGVTSIRIDIEEEHGNLAIVEPTPRGGPGESITDTERNLIPFNIDHFQRDDLIKADEVQGIRAFGETDVLESAISLVDRKAARHMRHFDMTLEHQRAGALRGVVVSGKGRILHNLYNRFGIAVPAAVDLAIASGDVEKLDILVKGGIVRSIEDDLDMPYTGIHAFCGSDYHEKMWAQKWVRDTFLNTTGAAQLRLDVPDIFTFAGVTWERYKMGKKATDANGGNGFIASDEAIAFPTGVPDFLMTRFAPADYMETVNTPGLPFYVKVIPTDNNKGVRLEMQTNSISLCTRPGALRRLTMS